VHALGAPGRDVARRLHLGYLFAGYLFAVPMLGPQQIGTTKETSMNSRFLKLTAIMGALMVGTACSATRTQESAGEVIDDSVLTAKVKAGLIDDPVTKAGQINVETYRGVVQLGGFVDNAASKNQATVVARSVTGVKEVRNDLQISSPQATAGQAIDDGTLTASVKAKLVEDSTTKAHQINVETQKGVVQLTGFVNSNEAKARAGELARSVDGVAEVRNDLEIRQN
jgi:hyperosmotically inducible protein